MRADNFVILRRKPVKVYYLFITINLYAEYLFYLLNKSKSCKTCKFRYLQGFGIDQYK